jgi:C4-dicarboxylate-specific signal transduction histidine kinase
VWNCRYSQKHTDTKEADAGSKRQAVSCTAYPRSFATLFDSIFRYAQPLLRTGLDVAIPHLQRRNDSERRSQEVPRAGLMRGGTSQYWHTHFASPEGAVVNVPAERESEPSLQAARAELEHVVFMAAVRIFMASIDHEISQPLTCLVANGYASQRWLSMQPPNLDEARRAVADMVRQADRARNGITRIRDLSRKTPLEHLLLDINQIIRHVLTLSVGELRGGGVTVLTELSSDLPPLRGDSVHLQQVVLSLVTNAINAMSGVIDRPRELSMKSAKDSVGVVVQVRDSGVGVRSSISETIFEPFFTTKPHALGLGLSISRSIIEAHGGRLWVTAGDFHGAVFQFTLPKVKDSK